MAPARASFRLLPQPAGSRSRVAALAPWRGFTEVPMPRVLRPVLHGNPASLAGRLARSPGIIGRHAAPHGREKVPPKRCHRGWHPPRMPRRKGQPAGMRTVSSGTTRLLLHARAASIWQRASERRSRVLPHAGSTRCLARRPGRHRHLDHRRRAGQDHRKLPDDADRQARRGTGAGCHGLLARPLA